VRARILPPEEYHRLEGRRFPELMPYTAPENMAVVVVEDGDEIVACVSALRVTHFEGLWVSPWHRGNPGIGRALLRLATAIPRVRGEQWVFGGIEDARMAGFMERLGGVRIPLDLYALWTGTDEGRQEWQSLQSPRQPQRAG
jgi:hypothetical protein